MNDREINTRIAELRGGGSSHHANINASGLIRLATYTTDLNAMHEAERTLSPLLRAEYTINLRKLTMTRGIELDYVGATARQRAEAFLRTLGKWRDSEQPSA